MTNKERLEINNAKINEITRALARKQVSPTDMLQQRVDATNSCHYLFYYYQGDNLDFISGLDVSNVTHMDYMFSQCLKVPSIDVSKFDTSQVVTMEGMFNGCSALTSLDLSNFNTSKVTKMSSMFSGCSALTSLDVSKFDTSQVTEFYYMFSVCSKLTSLDLSNFDMSKNTSVYGMFNRCKNLKSLNLSCLNVVNAGQLNNMFYSCENLENLDISNLDTSKVKDFSSMFYQCYKLKTITNINLIRATSVGSIFSDCRALTNLEVKNIKKSLTIGRGSSGVYLSWGFLLTNESLINTIKELWDLTGSTSQTLTMSTTSKENIANIYVKLVDVTDEMRAEDEYIDSKKPCVVCESTDDGAMTLTEYAISKNWAIA